MSKELRIGFEPRFEALLDEAACPEVQDPSIFFPATEYEAELETSQEQLYAMVDERLEKVDPELSNGYSDEQRESAMNSVIKSRKIMISRDRDRQAKKICRECPVRIKCLDIIIDIEVNEGTQIGVWGGRNQHERRQLVRRRREKKNAA